MPDQPTISVVMSVYNGEKYLAKAIESILQQTYTDFEFIIVDDASTDGSPDILRYYQEADQRIQVIRNEENFGLGISLQRGIHSARGEFIARMDADDISLADRFEKQVEYLNRHQEIMVLGGDYLTIYEQDEIINDLTLPKDPEMMRWNMLLGSGIIVIHGTVMFRKELIVKVGNYGDFRAAQDFELWTRTFDVEPLPIANLDGVIYHYRHHGETTTHSLNSLQERIAIQVRLKKIEEFLGKPVPQEVVLAYRYPAYAYANIQICIQTWLEIYQKFLREFKVSTEARREIQKEMISRLNKYSYLPCQKTNIQFRMPFFKLLTWLPFDMSLRLISTKLGWILKHL